MKKIIAYFKGNSLIIYRILLFLLAAAIIVGIFPKEGKFRYEFQRGKPWMHEDLIAPFDFPILKTDAELAQEREAVLAQVKPYFLFSEAVFAESRKRLIEDFDKIWREMHEENDAEKAWQRLLMLNIYDSIFNAGIIERHAVIDGKPDEFLITLLRRNIAVERELRSFFTLQTADAFIKDHFSRLSPEGDYNFIIRIIENRLAQNVLFDPATTERERQTMLERISLARGMIQKGERIISKGDVVGPDRFQVLESFRREYELQVGGSSAYIGIIVGQSILVVIALSVFMLFLVFFRPEIFQQNKMVLFMLLVLLMMVALLSFMARYHPEYLYLVPLCLVPIIIRIFSDTRLALFVHLVTIFITGFLVPNSFEFVFLQLIAGIIAIISVVNLQKRSQFAKSVFFIFLTYVAIYSGMNLMQEGNFSTMQPNMFMMFGGSAMLTLLAYPLIYIFEKIFGFTTDLTLLELSDTNNKLLRKLAEKAPGTFQHSMQVAAIAEELTREIGGNPLLVRTGALYHDIGKMNNPLYFIENQITGVNPHDELSYEESARIIISHVIEGVEMARKQNLPEILIDFIRTHHGTRKTGYFYIMQKNENPDVEVNEELFTYHGPIPFSRETAVVMMADSVEAASRSIKKPNQQKLDELVENIITSQVEDNQFDNSPITMRDITRIKRILKKKLMNIYHVRIEYPVA
ncbi:MAG TPA: HDIG domain-containing protein [Bacteroidales bacterium]|nr:HDIG domain-containing protein [Bacteroidales bacterium]